jgi:hypothetical protein
MKGTTVTPAARVWGEAASALVPSLGRLLAMMARTPLRCMRASTSASGCGPVLAAWGRPNASSL